MKYIVFSYDYPPNDGGISRLCFEIAQGLTKNGFEVIVLTQSSNKSDIVHYNKKVILCEKRVRSNRISREIDALCYLNNIRDKENYTIICGLWNSEAWISLLAGFNNVVVLAHGAELLLDNTMFRRHIWTRIARLTLRKSKYIIANSDYTSVLVKSLTHKNNVYSVPLAVDSNFFSPASFEYKHSVSNLVLGTVSRIEKFKAHDFVIRTISLLPSKYRNKVLYKIAGNGPYKENLVELVSSLGLESQVQFVGFVPDDEIPDFYNSLDCFILCTREERRKSSVEGFGLVFLESQSCGIPVIGSSSGGIPSAVENGNGGWLIKEDDTKKLLSLIIYLLDNKGSCIKQGYKARKRVLNDFTWEHYLNRFMKIIKD